MEIDEDKLKSFLEFDSELKPNGVVPVYKSVGITSHRVVEILRRKLKTRKIGHAGTLDPFAEGLLIMLVGKSTKLSDQFLGKDKTYEATMIVGIGTNSGDVEGEIVKVEQKDISIVEITNAINSFAPEYTQYVPVFSSVKVKGQKLRELARSCEKFEMIEENGIKIINFYRDNKIFHTLELPYKVVKIYSVEKIEVEKVSLDSLTDDYTFKSRVKEQSDVDTKVFHKVKFTVKVSKGTYIRQLAVDIGANLGTFAVLTQLKRTQIGDLSVENAILI